MSKSTSKRNIREEIKEYSHLLRALKTSSIADLATRIHPSQSITLLEQGESSNPNQFGKKEYWTRWPLMPAEVFPPSISFEEEFVSLAEQELSKDSQYDEDIGSESISPSDGSEISSSTLYALGRALCVLSESFPHVDKGVQHRVQASDWRLVLDALTESDVFPDE